MERPNYQSTSTNGGVTEGVENKGGPSWGTGDKKGRITSQRKLRKEKGAQEIFKRRDSEESVTERMAWALASVLRGVYAEL